MRVLKRHLVHACMKRSNSQRGARNTQKKQVSDSTCCFLPVTSPSHIEKNLGVGQAPCVSGHQLSALSTGWQVQLDKILLASSPTRGLTYTWTWVKKILEIQDNLLTEWRFLPHNHDFSKKLPLTSDAQKTAKFRLNKLIHIMMYLNNFQSQIGNGHIF